MTVSGLRFDTHCPHCGQPLVFVDNWQPSNVTSSARMDCTRCKVRWAIEVRMALASRLPRRAYPQQASPPSR